MQIKNNLAKLIKESPYKREYVQNYVGVSRNTLINWINGKTYPNVPQLLKLAKLFKVKVEEIYKLEEFDDEEIY
jgi:putative transcriptional regulator